MFLTAMSYLKAKEVAGNGGDVQEISNIFSKCVMHDLSKQQHNVMYI